MAWNYPSSDFQFIGINEIGRNEFGNGTDANAAFTDGRHLPWLLDTDANLNGVSDVWYDIWQITYRDIVLVDEANNEVARYNVTDNNLALEDNYMALREMTTAQSTFTPATDWQAPNEKLDVNNDSYVAPLDALLIINNLGLFPNGQLPQIQGTPGIFYDTTGDNLISSQDAILIINHLLVMGGASTAAQAPLSGEATAEPDEFGGVAIENVARADVLAVAADADVAPSEDAARETVQGNVQLRSWRHDALADETLSHGERPEDIQYRRAVDHLFGQ